jgi:hypothetical protein
MKKNEIISRFSYKNRNFLISIGKSSEEENECMQLSEVVHVQEKPLMHFMESDGSLVKTDPLVLAIRNEEYGEIQISMHYEGLPIDLLHRLFEMIETRWQNPAHATK